MWETSTHRLAIFIVVQIANKLVVHVLVAPHLQVALQLYNSPITFAGTLSEIKDYSISIYFLKVSKNRFRNVLPKLNEY